MILIYIACPDQMSKFYVSLIVNYFSICLFWSTNITKTLTKPVFAFFITKTVFITLPWPKEIDTAVDSWESPETSYHHFHTSHHSIVPLLYSCSDINSTKCQATICIIVTHGVIHIGVHLIIKIKTHWNAYCPLFLVVFFTGHHVTVDLHRSKSCGDVVHATLIRKNIRAVSGRTDIWFDHIGTHQHGKQRRQTQQQDLSLMINVWQNHSYSHLQKLTIMFVIIASCVQLRGSDAPEIQSLY